jgi:hypothetical protein
MPLTLVRFCIRFNHQVLWYPNRHFPSNPPVPEERKSACEARIAPPEPPLPLRPWWVVHTRFSKNFLFYLAIVFKQ